MIATVVPAGDVANLELARGLAHAHLAEILDCSTTIEPSALPEGVRAPAGSGIAVAELVPGRTLHQHLAGKPMSPVKAVAWALRLIEAVSALHARGAFHGAISPYSVIAEPDGRAMAPVLSRLVAPAVGVYCSPERLKGAAPGPSEDVWAICATLYTALTGHHPFEGTSRDALVKEMLGKRPKPLTAWGVKEPALSEILERGLTGDRRQRVLELAELGKLLDAWERNPTAMPPKRALLPRATSRGSLDGGIPTVPSPNPPEGIVMDARTLADDEGVAPAWTPKPIELPPPDLALLLPMNTPALGALTRDVRPVPPPLPPQPPPLPPVAAGLPSKRVSINPFERKRRVWPLVVCAAVLSGAGVYLALGNSDAPAPVAATPQPAAAGAAPAVTKPAPVQRDPVEQLNSCVLSYFPEETWKEPPDFAFVCGDGDFREISRALFASAAGAAPEEAHDPARARRSELGWYELPATTIIRRSCCPGAAPVVLPETVGWCEQLQSVMRRIADDSAKAGDLAPAARAFDKAVSCLFANRIPKPYLYDRAPSAANRRAFQHFLSRAAISEARR